MIRSVTGKFRIRGRFLLIMVLILLFTANGFAQNGEQLFKANCAACHSTGENRMVGPGLKGINAKRKPEWLLSWIRNSGELIKSGDADAKAIYEEFGKIMMPPTQLSDVEIKSILTYIENPDAGKKETAAVTPVAAPQPEPGLTPFQLTLIMTLAMFFILYLSVYFWLMRLHNNLRAKGVIGIPIMNESLTDRFLNWSEKHKNLVIGIFLLIFLGGVAGLVRTLTPYL